MTYGRTHSRPVSARDRRPCHQKQVVASSNCPNRSRSRSSESHAPPEDQSLDSPCHAGRRSQKRMPIKASSRSHLRNFCPPGDTTTPGAPDYVGSVIQLARIPFEENVVALAIPAAKVDGLPATSPRRRPACREKRKTQITGSKLEKLLPAFCRRRPKDPTARRSIVYTPPS